MGESGLQLKKHWKDYSKSDKLNQESDSVRSAEITYLMFFPASLRKASASSSDSSPYIHILQKHERPISYKWTLYEAISICRLLD